MSSQIYELFGFPIDDRGAKATETRKQCLCPFLGHPCDGGGNRYQSSLNPASDKCDKYLAAFFKGRTKDIPAGVCSLTTSDRIWIVCPRRLFVLDRGGDPTPHEEFCKGLLRRYVPDSLSGKIGVWSEVKIKYSEEAAAEEEESEKMFDYTFDYILCPVRPKRLSEVAAQMKESEKKIESACLEKGFTIASRRSEKYVEDYPDGQPLIIEVMTSSTSGGNKAKGTTIQDAFCKAILGQPHSAPGINYRQIWARMVSQLIVKSQIGRAWGGKTVWILQDALASYISNTTDLNLRKLISTALREVNILSLRYTRQHKGDMHPLEIDNLYAGEIPPISGDTDFNKLLQAASIPPLSLLQSKLLGKKPRTFLFIN